MEDEEMEFLNGICKKEVTEWDELTGTSLLNQDHKSHIAHITDAVNGSFQNYFLI